MNWFTILSEHASQKPIYVIQYQYGYIFIFEKKLVKIHLLVSLPFNLLFLINLFPQYAFQNKHQKICNPWLTNLIDYILLEQLKKRTLFS